MTTETPPVVPDQKKQEPKKKQSKKRPLTILEERFIEEYMIDGNAKRAHKAAGYSAKSENAHEVAGAVLLRKQKVADAIARSRRAMVRRSHIEQDQVQKEFGLVGFSDMADYISWNPNGDVIVKGSEEMDPEKRRAIKTFRKRTVQYHDKEGAVVRTTTDVEIVLHDKVRALEGLAEQLGMVKKEPDQPSEFHVHFHDHRFLDKQLGLKKDRAIEARAEVVPSIEQAEPQA